MNEQLEANLALCRRLASAGAIAVPVYSLPFPDLEARTAKAVGGFVRTKPMIGRRVHFGMAFMDESKRSVKL